MQIHMEVKINAPADEAWKVLGEGFGAISDWTSSLKASSLDGGLKAGGVRTCESGPARAIVNAISIDRINLLMTPFSIKLFF